MSRRAWKPGRCAASHSAARSAPAARPPRPAPAPAGADSGDSAAPAPPGEYSLPPLDLLQPLPAGNERALPDNQLTTSKILQETLAEFGITCEVKHVEQGPVVTRYELLPAPGVRVEKIGSLANNIALTLKATSIRIQAPVPGKGVVGIEVPNSSATKVYLREIGLVPLLTPAEEIQLARRVQTGDEQARQQQVVFLGKDEDGQPVRVPREAWRKTNIQILGVPIGGV